MRLILNSGWIHIYAFLTIPSNPRMNHYLCNKGTAHYPIKKEHFAALFLNYLHDD